MTDMSAPGNRGIAVWCSSQDRPCKINNSRAVFALTNDAVYFGSQRELLWCLFAERRCRKAEDTDHRAGTASPWLVNLTMLVPAGA